MKSDGGSLADDAALADGDGPVVGYDPRTRLNDGVGAHSDCVSAIYEDLWADEGVGGGFYFGDGHGDGGIEVFRAGSCIFSLTLRHSLKLGLVSRSKVSIDILGHSELTCGMKACFSIH